MNFDFKKDDTEKAEDCAYSEVIDGKKQKVCVEESLNKESKALDSSIMPQGFWALMIAATTLYFMYNGVIGAGWGLVLAFFMLDKKSGLLIFLFAALSMLGMSLGIPYAGWLLFFAFLV